MNMTPLIASFGSNNTYPFGYYFENMNDGTNNVIRDFSPSPIVRKNTIHSNIS